MFRKTRDAPAPEPPLVLMRYRFGPLAADTAPKLVVALTKEATPEEKKLPVAVRAVNAPVFGVVFPIGGGEASKPEKKLVEPIRLTVKPLGADMMTS